MSELAIVIVLSATNMLLLLIFNKLSEIHRTLILGRIGE